MPLPALLIVALLGGCAGTLGSRSPSRVAQTRTVVAPGDVLVGLVGTDRRREDGLRVARLRRTIDDDGTSHVAVRPLMRTEGAVAEVVATGDAAWIAVTLVLWDDARRVDLFRLRPGGEPERVWQSPLGCTTPTFHPGAAWLAMACPPEGRQPAWLLRVALPDLRVLALVGERPRTAPSAGTEGDLYWVEATATRSVVFRRPARSDPFATHAIVGRVSALHPQLSGSLVALVDGARGPDEAVELLPSGEVRPYRLPDQLRAADLAGPHAVSPFGEWTAVRCARGPCSIVESSVLGGPDASLSLGDLPTAVGRVPRLHRASPRPEDLATAPSTVLASHLASEVSVLGVELGMPLTEAFAVLERGDRQPWWDSVAGPRARPRGIGIGRAEGSWCIEFEADDRGVVVGVEIRDCAASYLSPAIRPLWDREGLADDAAGVARRFLGPGVSVEVGDGDGKPGEIREHPLRRTRLLYDAPERGYRFQSQTETLEARAGQLWDGWVWLRLEAPGRRQTARRP